MESIEKLLFSDRRAAEAADLLEGDISLTLSEEQSKQLEQFVAKNGKMPSKIEMNFKAGFERSALIPVTVLVGAMA